MQVRGSGKSGKGVRRLRCAFAIRGVLTCAVPCGRSIKERELVISIVAYKELDSILNLFIQSWKTKKFISKMNSIQLLGNEEFLSCKKSMVDPFHVGRW